MTSMSVFRSGRPDIAGIEFDVKLSENHDLNATITLYPIEGVAEDIVEHVILEPRIVTIEVYTSNIDDDNRAIGQNASRALDDLEKMRLDRTMHDLITDHAIYSNMVLKTIDASTPGSGPTDSYSMAYTVTFQQIILLGTSSVLIPPEQLNDVPGTSKGQPVDKSASTEVDAGTKSASIV